MGAGNTPDPVIVALCEQVERYRAECRAANHGPVDMERATAAIRDIAIQIVRGTAPNILNASPKG